MHCERCLSLMSYEGFYGCKSEAFWYYPGWRCVYCGEIVDDTISLNRCSPNIIHNRERKRFTPVFNLNKTDGKYIYSPENEDGEEF